MAERIIEVFTKLVSADTPDKEVEDKVAVILEELKMYYQKRGVFARDVIWKKIEEQVPYAWWEQWGGNNMPAAFEYIVRLEAVIANQTAAERAFKAYKFVNGKLTTHSATPTASQFRSEDSETETTGTMRASLYTRLNSKTDDFSWLTGDYIIDGSKFELKDLSTLSDIAAIFNPSAERPTLSEDARDLNDYIETWEQPTKKSTTVLVRLERKYLGLGLMDDDEENSDDEGAQTDLRDPVYRKIDTVTWKTGRGNSYVVNACNVNPDGTTNRDVITEYKIDVVLLALIRSAASSGKNEGVKFIPMAVARTGTGQTQHLEPTTPTDAIPQPPSTVS